MSFTAYITYQEYVGLGGTVTEDAFPNLEKKAQYLLDYFTFNRIKYLTVIPDEVKDVLTQFIDSMNSFNKQSNSGDTLTQYSNGVESMSFKVKTEAEINSDMLKIAEKWLPDYLLARGVNFDVEQYLQSNSNNS